MVGLLSIIGVEELALLEFAVELEVTGMLLFEVELELEPPGSSIPPVQLITPKVNKLTKRGFTFILATPSE